MKKLNGFLFKSTILIILLTNLFQKCKNNSDSVEELSGGYFYRNEGENIKDVLSHAPGHKNIYGKVIDYAYNNEFVLVLQEPNFEEYVVSVGFELRDKLDKYSANTQQDQVQSEKDADSILKHDISYQKIFSNKINYWIICNNADSIIGPLTKEKYMEERARLKVPESLQLKRDF